MQAAVKAAADSGFDRTGDHLVERRIAYESIGQIAGKIRVGAAEFDGGGSTVAFAVIAVKGVKAAGVIGEADGRIEALEDVYSGERAARAAGGQAVHIVDVGVVVAAGGGDGPLAEN